MTEHELKGPIKVVRFVHGAIRREGEDLRESISNLAPGDLEAARRLKDRMAAFEDVLRTHEDGEDLSLFPPMEARYRSVADTYEFDHERHRQHGATLAGLLDELARPVDSPRDDLVKAAGEEAVLFSGFMNLHIDKEDELLFPLYDEMFSVEEQMAHSIEAQKRVSQESMARIGTWSFQRLDLTGREGFLSNLKQMMPPEAFGGMTQGLMRSISANEWQELTQRLPGLPKAA